MKNPLKPNIINKLNYVFASQQWKPDSEEDEYCNLYQDFSKLLEFMSEEEQLLVLDLSLDFKYLPFSQYGPLLSKVISQVAADYISQFTNIIIVPLQNSTDKQYVKSDSALLYPCKHAFKRKYQTTTVEAYTSLSYLIDTKLTRTNSLIIYVDDFVGTGDTAISSLNFYFTNCSAKDDDVIILTLAAQQSGLNTIKDYGIAVYNAITVRRGISDSDLICNKPKALELVDGIEKRLKVQKQFRRGYKASEALVSLLRTPNNTFPLFWLKAKMGQDRWPAPFYR